MTTAGDSRLHGLLFKVEELHQMCVQYEELSVTCWIYVVYAGAGPNGSGGPERSNNTKQHIFINSFTDS